MKKLIVVLTIMSVVVSFISITTVSYAIADNGVTFVNQPVLKTEPTLVRTNNNNTNFYFEYNGIGDAYICYINSEFCVLSTESTYNNYRYFNSDNDSWNMNNTPGTPFIVNGTNWYIYYSAGSVNPPSGNIYVPYYNKSMNQTGIEEIVNDIENTSNNNGSVSNEINYLLPVGNVAIIETDSSYNYINLSTTMPLQSTSFANNPWPNTTQRIGYYNTLPQTLNPNTMGNVIEWERNGNTTLFNITTSAKYNPSVVSTFKYVVIANPYYYPANDMEGSQFTNGAISISMNGVVNITVKSLTATVNTQTGEVENNYNGEEWTGEVDETTNDIIWTDSNGDNNAPTNGGNLSDPSITGFQSWLKGILNNIVNIFEPAHDAISTLSSAVSNFASWLYALYVWLPSPILTLLTSAISLAIVIGIIKVFI